MKIFVTQNDIAVGDCALCPVERAFLGQGLETMVGPTDVSFFAANRYLLTLPLPPVAVRFVALFDKANPATPGLQPFSFDLEIPAEVVEAARA